MNYGGVAVPKSPFRVFVAQPLNPNKVQIFGPGIEPGVKSNKPNHFTIDCSEAGIGKLSQHLYKNVLMYCLDNLYTIYELIANERFYLLLLLLFVISSDSVLLKILKGFKVFKSVFQLMCRRMSPSVSRVAK